MPRVRCGARVSYERDVMGFGAMCELYEEVVTRVGWGCMTFFCGKMKKGVLLLLIHGGAIMGDKCGSRNQINARRM